MSNTDESRERIERLLAAADRVVQQPLPPKGPSPRGLMVTLLGVAGVIAVIVGVMMVSGGDDGPSTVTSQTTAVPTAVPTPVSTTLPLVITLPPTTLPAPSTTTLPPTTTTTTPIEWTEPIRTITYLGGRFLLRGSVPSHTTSRALVTTFAAAAGTSAVTDAYLVVPGAPLPASEPLDAQDAMQFPANSSELQPAAVELLDVLARLMAQNPQVTLDVRGYTDGVGPADSNLELSQARIDGIVYYLIAVGVEPERITGTAYGERAPIADDSTDEGRARNRRVEFTLHDLLP